MDAAAEHRVEDRRQLEHLVPVVFAVLLPFMPYWFVMCLSALAVLYALYISPRLIRVTTRREELGKTFSPGKVFYALSIMALLLVFRDRIYIAAAVWGILAVGDSLSNVVGRRMGKRPIPFNTSKTVEGFIAFWVSGWLAGWGLILWNWQGPQQYSVWTLSFFALVAAGFCALTESLPPVLDDNLSVPWTGATAFYLLFSLGPSAQAGGSWPQALAITGAAALIARSFNWLSWRGVAAAAVFGLIVYRSMGIPGFAVMSTFLILASLATKAGYARKRKLSIAQGRAGERGVINVLANGLVPLTIAGFYPWLPSPILRTAFTAAVATAAFDTVSTEIGQWLGRHPFDPVTFRRVPVGAKGAVSVEGTLAGILGASCVAFLAAALGWISVLAATLVLLGAFLGAMTESLMGSRFRFDFRYSDEALNLYSTFLGACLAATFCSLLA